MNKSFVFDEEGNVVPKQSKAMERANQIVENTLFMMKYSDKLEQHEIMHILTQMNKAMIECSG